MDRVDAEQFLPLTTLAFEVMLSVAEGQLNGYEIMTIIEQRTNGRLSPNPGTLYRALDRLLNEGLLEAIENHSGSSQDNRRLYRLSKLGMRVAEAEARRLEDQVKAAKARRLLKGRHGA